MTISDEELDELKRLLEKATPGPWTLSRGGYGVTLVAPDGGSMGALFPESIKGTKYDAEANADSLVALRNLAPRLLSHYRSARNDGIEEAAEVVHEMRNQMLVRRDACRREDTRGSVQEALMHNASAVILQSAALAITALKSPPQSEP